MSKASEYARLSDAANAAGIESLVMGSLTFSVLSTGDVVVITPNDRFHKTAGDILRLRDWITENFDELAP